VYGPELPPAAGKEAAGVAAGAGSSVAAGEGAAAGAAGPSDAAAPPAAMCAIIDKLLAFMSQHGTSFEVSPVFG
jgi:hypothetical protein